MNFIDISRDITTCDVYPGNPEPSFEVLKKIGEESACNLTRFTMCPHTGTHVDAPLHFIEDGADISAAVPEVFIGPCTVVETKVGVITGEDAENLLPKGCERLLIKGSGHSFFMDASAEIMADSGLRLIGTDSMSIGCHGNQIKPHKAFLMNGISILEGLDLSGVAPGEYFLIALPLKISGSEASPVRAVLCDDYIFWCGKNRR